LQHIATWPSKKLHLSERVGVPVETPIVLTFRVLEIFESLRNSRIKWKNLTVLQGREDGGVDDKNSTAPSEVTFRVALQPFERRRAIGAAQFGYV
jgi:hypothetical protein